MADLHAASARLFSEPKEGEAAADSSPPLELAPIPTTVTDDDGRAYQYDERVPRMLGGLADRLAPRLGRSPSDLRAEITRWSEIGAHRLADGYRLPPDQVDGLLERRSGSADRWPAEARALLDAEFPAAFRPDLEHWLNVTGMADSPALVAWLADIATQLRRA